MEQGEDVKVYACATTGTTCILPPLSEERGTKVYAVDRRTSAMVLYAQTAEPPRKKRLRRVDIRWMREDETLSRKTEHLTDNREQAFPLAREEEADTLRVSYYGDTDVEVVAVQAPSRRRRKGQ